MSSPLLVLGSSSESRVNLLKRIGYEADVIAHPEIDETPLKKELPHHTALRLAIAKAKKISQSYENDVVISADTVCAIGRLQLPKAMSQDEAEFCMKKLSGKRHRTYTGICGIRGSKIISKLSTTIIKFKILTERDIQEFLYNKLEWYGKAGGYTLMGLAAAFTIMMRGDESSGVLGLPLYHARNIIQTLGENKILKIHDKLRQF